MSTVPIMEGFKKERGKEREASGQRGKRRRRRRRKKKRKKHLENIQTKLTCFS